MPRINVRESLKEILGIVLFVVIIMIAISGFVLGLQLIQAGVI